MVVAVRRIRLFGIATIFAGIGACGRPPPPAASEPEEVQPASVPRTSRCDALPSPAAASTQPVRVAPGCHELSIDHQRNIGATLEREVRGRDEGLIVKVDFPCSPIDENPASMAAVWVAGHGGATRVVEIKRSERDRFVARTMEAVPRTFDATNLAGPRSNFSRVEVPEAEVTRAFDRIRTALAARVVTERRPVPGDQIALGPIAISDDLTLVEVRLRDMRGVEFDRHYAGYVGNVDANERVPVQLAWQALEAVLPAATPRDSADSNDRVLLRTIWAGSASTTWYGEQGLLALATSAGSQELITPITRALGNPSPFTRGLAVSALAAITGWDARRDESGAVRPLEAVVADYQRECARP